RLVYAALAIHHVVALDADERAQQLRVIDAQITGAVHLLQTIQPDVRLTRYSHALSSEIQHVLANPAYQPFQDVAPEVMARLGFPAGMRPPTPDTLQMIELAG